jgi:hypothetical protein
MKRLDSKSRVLAIGFEYQKLGKRPPEICGI